jgi:capsular exopolysaccharide synthesis family protein
MAMQALDGRIPRSLIREEQFNLQQYLGIVNRHKFWILLVTLLATALAAAAVLAMQPIYRATATVLVESKVANVVSIQNVYGMDTESQAYFDTQFEIIKSRRLAQQVVADLGLGAPPGERAPGLLERWAPSLAPHWPASDAAVEAPGADAAVNAYLASLTVTPVPKTQLVRVSFDTTDPELAARVANRHADAFIRSNLEAQDAVSGRATEWMRERLEELRANLDESERRLQQFKEQEQLVDIAGIQTLSTQALEEMSTNLASLRRDLSASRNTYQQVERARGKGLDALLSVPVIKSDPLVQQFKQSRAVAQMKVAELARRYGPQHPKMVAAGSELEAAERALTLHVENVVAAVRNEYEVSEAQVGTVATAVEGARSDVHSVGRKESQFRILQREADTNRELYDLFYNRIRETAETTDLASPVARVIDPAVAAAEPIRPRKGLAVSMAFTVALVGSLLCAFLYELVSGKIKHPGEVEQKLGLPLLGYLPVVRRARRRRLPVARRFAETRSDRREREFAEMVRSIRTGLVLGGLNERRRVIMVTSTLSGEGKTTVAGNLALALAQMERVLLVDADLRRPTIAREFGLDPAAPGLAELLAGERHVGECIASCDDGLDLLPAGRVPAQPLELLGSPAFGALLDELIVRYDRILLDCPPLLPVSDPLLLAQRADALIYVIKANATGAGRIRTALKLLQRTPLPVTGVVLNQLDVKRAAQYGDYGSVGYYETYEPRSS